MRQGDAGAAGALITDPGTLEELRSRLLIWGRENRRTFPWRETRDPWRVLLAEVLLHRTRADQVVPVYLAAVERYPDPAAMARAHLRDLRRLMRPLGLHWRVPLMREMARQILRRHGGRIPPDRQALQALPGVSDYIAGAVCCFAFGMPEPVLDTNTVRVLGRLFGLPVRDSSRRSRRFRDLMARLIDGPNPRELTLSMLDLAAQICHPRDPECPVCPLRELCAHGRSHGTEKRAAGGAGP
jgi:A/G-specific adenine glycosylase